MADKSLPVTCPACGGSLQVAELCCDRCETTGGGRYELPELARLSRDDRDFVLRFVLASGSLKEIASQLGVSYPTVRNRLNDIIERLRARAETGQGDER